MNDQEKAFQKGLCESYFATGFLLGFAICLGLVGLALWVSA